MGKDCAKDLPDESSCCATPLKCGEKCHHCVISIHTAKKLRTPTEETLSKLGNICWYLFIIALVFNVGTVYAIALLIAMLVFYEFS